MSYLEPFTSTPLSQRRPQATINGQSIAQHPMWWRACLAARWISGDLAIEAPTVEQAADLFGVRESLVEEALQKVEATAVSPLEMAWQAASPAQRADFANDHPEALSHLIGT